MPKILVKRLRFLSGRFHVVVLALGVGNGIWPQIAGAPRWELCPMTKLIHRVVLSTAWLIGLFVLGIQIGLAVLARLDACPTGSCGPPAAPSDAPARILATLSV